MLGHDGGSGQRKQPDVLEFGRDRRASRWRVPHLLLVLLVIGTGLVVYVRASGHHASPAHRTQAPPTVSAPPPIRVTLTGHRMLGVSAGWQLIARGLDDLIRIQLSLGRVTLTYVPPLESSSPSVAFVLAAHQALIRPADLVPGYVVPDGSQARPLTGLLAHSGPMLPGPPGTPTAWVLLVGPPATPSLSLVTLTGHRTGTQIPFPPGEALLPATAVADGRGDALMITGTFAVHDVGPGWNHPVPGTVIAVGKATWLTVTCGTRPAHCRYVVIDSADDTRRSLPARVQNDPSTFEWPPGGVIAPDGAEAAVPLAGPGGSTTVHLISMRTGVSTDLGVRLSATGGYQQSMAWSPDSRWLFVASASGKLVAINARSGQAQSLGLKLPGIEQVAIRP